MSERRRGDAGVGIAVSRRTVVGERGGRGCGRRRRGDSAAGSGTAPGAFSLGAVIAAVLLMQVVRVVFHDFTGLKVIDLLTYIATAGVLVNQVRLLLVAQLRGRWAR